VQAGADALGVLPADPGLHGGVDPPATAVSSTVDAASGTAAE
jgi:hypothetical protein